MSYVKYLKKMNLTTENKIIKEFIYEKGNLRRLKKEQYYIKKIKKTYVKKILKRDSLVIENYFII